MDNHEARLAECLRVLEETGDLDRCLELYPELASELREHTVAVQALAALAPPSPREQPRLSSRRLLLSSLASREEGGQGLLRTLFGKKAAAIAAGAVMLFAAASVGASPIETPLSHPVNDVLDTLGLGADSPGKPVRDAVHDAIESTDPGPERGKAVSQAACEAAHDPERLPENARAVHEEKDTQKDCDKADGSGSNEEEDQGAPGSQQQGGKPETPPGLERNNGNGTEKPGASQRACEAAGERPAQANAGGNGPKGPKGCEE